jgi:tRNA(fMet)-specific endonuclease VapC
MLILDTDLFSIIQRGASAEYSRLLARLPRLDQQSVCVTIVSFEEQTRGWLTYVARAKTGEQQIEAYVRLHRLLNSYCNRRVIDFDAAAMQRYYQLVKSRIRIGAMDLRIASIALTQGATLLSRKLGDFRKVPGLVVEDWSA